MTRKSSAVAAVVMIFPWKPSRTGGTRPGWSMWAWVRKTASLAVGSNGRVAVERVGIEALVHPQSRGTAGRWRTRWMHETRYFSRRARKVIFMGIRPLSFESEKQNQAGQSARFDSYNSYSGCATELSPRERSVGQSTGVKSNPGKPERWDRLARHYGLVERLSERYLQSWRGVLWKRASGRILEIGAGTGLNLPNYPAGADITACDLFPGACSARPWNAHARETSASFCEADICRLPSPTAPSTPPRRLRLLLPGRSVPCLREIGTRDESGRSSPPARPRADRPPGHRPLMDLLKRRDGAVRRRAHHPPDGRARARCGSRDRGEPRARLHGNHPVHRRATLSGQKLRSLEGKKVRKGKREEAAAGP